MSELVVSLFRDHQRAPEVLNELRRHEYRWSEELNQALVLTLDLSGQVKAEISLDPSGCDANSWIRVWSSLLGGALFISGAQVLIDTAEGITCSTPLECHQSRTLPLSQHLKWWRDSVRLSDDFRRDLAAALSSGGSAIFIFFKSNCAAGVLAQLRTFGDIIIHTALTPEQDEELAKLTNVMGEQNTESLVGQIP